LKGCLRGAKTLNTIERDLRGAKTLNTIERDLRGAKTLNTIEREFKRGTVTKYPQEGSLRGALPLF